MKNDMNKKKIKPVVRSVSSNFATPMKIIKPALYSKWADTTISQCMSIGAIVLPKIPNAEYPHILLTEFITGERKVIQWDRPLDTVLKVVTHEIAKNVGITPVSYNRWHPVQQEKWQVDCRNDSVIIQYAMFGKEDQSNFKKIVKWFKEDPEDE
tara:strand:- start:333 stop:794 length:462 start_codon:yes stop_codon:yes gene_type:complete